MVRNRARNKTTDQSTKKAKPGKKSTARSTTKVEKRAKSKAAKRAKSKAARRGRVSFDCMVFRQGSVDLALFPASAKALSRVVNVNTFEDTEERREHGYQRVLSKARYRKIARSIDDGLLLPNSVLISFDADRAELDKTEQKIFIENIENAGWIIDGQHRLAGANEAERDIIVPVVAFVGLSLEGQVEQFVTINKEQKGVPPSLYYELLHRLPEGGKTAAQIANERASDLAKQLRDDPDSPLYRRIVFKVTRGFPEISLTNFVRKTASLVRRPSGMLSRYNDEDRAQIINNYFNGLRLVYTREYDSRESIFFKTVGFGALMNAFPYIFEYSLSSYGKSFTVANVVEIFRRDEGYNFDAWKQGGTGTAAENDASRDLIEALDLEVELGQVQLTD